MKLLLDENLSRRLVPFLQHDYPESSQVVLLGLESASDQRVWQTARENGFVIVTRDADFQELSLILGQPPQGGQARHAYPISCGHSKAITGKPPVDRRCFSQSRFCIH